MSDNFIDKKIIIKELNPEQVTQDIILLENNERQISQICEFLNSNDHILTVTGFSGTGKTSVIDFVCSNVNSDVIILKYNCFETTTLDDMFLSFFEIFRTYTVQGKIPPLKTKTENFSQKITSYFNNIQNKIIVVINSFEAILKNNKQNILDFINEINQQENVKIIIASRTMMTKDLQNFTFSNVPILAMQQSLFEKHLRTNGIKHIGVLSNELYKQTKGYYNNLVLSENVINLNGLNLGQFLEQYSKSLTPFIEYIRREILCFVDPVSAHLFRLLTIMRIPIHINLIKSLHLYDEEKIEFFLSQSILDKDGECLYLKDSFRSIIENQIPEAVLIKLHSSCIDLYNTQLPLKPLERDLRLSRQTMRNEIEYHEMFIPKKPEIHFKQVNVVAHSDTILEKPVEEHPVVAEPIVEETKEEKINKISFVFDDNEVLDNIAQSISGFVKEKDDKNKIIHEYNDYDLMKIINLAKQEEQQQNYSNAILLYQNALTKKDDENYYTFLPTIYLKLAHINKIISQWYEALEYFVQAQDFYYNVENFEKVWNIKYETAEIYYTLYKHDNARFILDELEYNNEIPNDLRIKVNLLQIKLCNNINQEYSYYKKSLSLIDSKTPKEITTELYYKFAGINDERNETKLAVQYYKKCISTDSNPKTNRFIPCAFANLAEIYYDLNYTDLAIKFYLESLKTEQSILGKYDCCVRISEILSELGKDKELEYLEKAVEYAKQLNENIYITEAYLNLSSYFQYKKEYNNAIKNAEEALNHAVSKDKKESIIKKLELLTEKTKDKNEQ